MLEMTLNPFIPDSRFTFKKSANSFHSDLHLLSVSMTCRVLDRQTCSGMSALILCHLWMSSLARQVIGVYRPAVTSTSQSKAKSFFYGGTEVHGEFRTALVHFRSVKQLHLTMNISDVRVTSLSQSLTAGKQNCSTSARLAQCF